MEGKEQEATLDIPWAWIKAVQENLSNTDFGEEDPQLPVELCSWLYMSDMYSVRSNLPELRDNFGITHVLTTNALSKFEMKRYREEIASANLKHCVVRGEDDASYDMIGKHWETCHEFMEEAKKSGGKVVVHCVAGLNRSGLIAGAALLTMTDPDEEGGRLDLMTVVQTLKEKRGDMVLFNQSFQYQLCLLAAKEGLLGDKPEGFDDEPLTNYHARSSSSTPPILLLKAPPPPIRSSLDKLAG